MPTQPFRGWSLVKLHRALAETQAALAVKLPDCTPLEHLTDDRLIRGMIAGILDEIDHRESVPESTGSVESVAV